jgi:hypothetical protein
MVWEWKTSFIGTQSYQESGTMESKFKSKVALVAIALLFVSLLSTGTARADELYGKIRGVIMDATGAALPGVQLKLTNADTGISKTDTSGTDGSYIFVNLIPGKYNLSATKANFKLAEVKGMAIAQNQTFVQNVNMELGAVSETVEVVANPVQVESTSMQLSTSLSGDVIRDVPLNGRNWIVLQQTLPGVVAADTRFGSNFSTNGSQAQQNSYLVNGNDANDLPLNSPLVQPNPDAIAEVQMVTNTINPEFGRNSGAILNAVTKSGTNNFHGTAFEFYRDTFLNTHNYFQLTPPVFHQHQYGGTIGGPVWKNKLFFFYGLQLTRNRVPDTNGVGAVTVYTPAQLAGNFDATLISTNVSPFPVVGSNGTTYPKGTAWNVIFPNNGSGVAVVPTGDYNSLASQLVQKFVPAANCNGNQYCYNPTTAGKTNQHIGRMDLTVGPKDSVWFYALANDQTSTNTLPFSGATLPGFGDGSIPYTKQFTASWNHTFTGNVLNELRLGYTRLNFKTGQPNTVRQPKDVGFPNIFPQLTSGADYPQMALTGYFTLGGTSNGPQPRKDQTYQLTDNFSYIRGRHNLKFGFDGRRFQVWNPFAARNDGFFGFDASGTYSTGDPGLDFLLGIPQSYNQQSGQIIIAQAHEYYFYAQDQWRAKDNFTLTLGVGYQIDTPIEEFQNHGLSRVCFEPGIQSTAFPDAPVGYTFPGDPGCNKYGGATTKYNHFGPRIGFAYSPNWGSLTGGAGKTSIRGGFGLYFNRSEEELNLQDLGDPPFGLGSNGVSDIGLSPSFPDPWTDIAGRGSLANKFPYVAPPAGTTGIDFSVFYPLAISVVPKNLTTPYAYNWNLTVERELPMRSILRVGYVGSHGSKLLTSYSFNPTTPAGVQACVADPACSGGNRIFQPILYPSHYQYDGGIWGNSGIQTNGGWSNYNSLQVTLDKHMGHGLEFRSAYTWSHALDVSSSFEDTSFQASGGVDAYGNFRRDYGNSAFDSRHRWVVTMTYEIPDLAKHLNWGEGASRALGGWRITGINAMQKGFPINFQDSSYRSLTCTGVLSFYGCPDRPDIITAPTVIDPRTTTTHLYFANPTGTFAHNAFGTQGNTPRGYLKGPGLWNDDFSLQKDTKVLEGKVIQLRIEFFNLLNHTNFANPNGNRNSGNFGRITTVQRNTNSRLIQLGAKFVF